MSVTMHRAELVIRIEGERPTVMVDCSAEFDRDRGLWRAWDELGNEVHDEWKNRAILRCLAVRLGVPMDGDNQPSKT